MIAFGVGHRACPAGSLSLLLARELTIAALNAVELRVPPGRPVDGLLPCAEPAAVDSDHASSKPVARPVIDETPAATQLVNEMAAVGREGALGGQMVATVEQHRVEYYWEANTRALPVLALTTPADVSVRLRQAPDQ